MRARQERSAVAATATTGNKPCIFKAQMKGILDVPLLGPDEGAPASFNYVIERPAPGAPAVLRRVAATCRPDPAYDGRLNEAPV